MQLTGRPGRGVRTDGLGNVTSCSIDDLAGLVRTRIKGMQYWHCLLDGWLTPSRWGRNGRIFERTARVGGRAGSGGATLMGDRSVCPRRAASAIMHSGRRETPLAPGGRARPWTMAASELGGHLAPLGVGPKPPDHRNRRIEDDSGEELSTTTSVIPAQPRAST